MAQNNNSNSRSGRNGSPSNASGRGGIRGNNSSTLNLFDVNVRDTTGKVDKIFNYTRSQVTSNEKFVTKSINKIFNNLDSRFNQSVSSMDSSINALINNLNSGITSAFNQINTNGTRSVDQITRQTRQKYDQMYRDIDRMDQRFNRNRSGRNRGNAGGGRNNNGGNPLPNNNGSSGRFDVRGSYTEPEKQQNGEKFSVQAVINSMKADNDAKFKQQQDNIVKALNDKVAAGDMTEDRAKSLYGRWMTESGSAKNHGATDTKLTAISNGVNIISQFIKVLVGDFMDGAKEFYQAYEANYNNMSTRLDADKSGVDSALKAGFKDIEDSNLKSVVNYSKDLLPALNTVANQGLLGDNAVAKAVNDSISKKIMPWLETSSEAWVNMSANMSEDNLQMIKGQQFLMQGTEAGNRILQSGVMNSLTSQMEPLLRNIDFNTGGSSNMTDEAQAMMTSMVDQGFNPQEAYEYVSKLVNVSKDQYGAITSGDVSQIIAAQTMANGGGLGDAATAIADSAGKIAAGADSDLGTSAAVNALGSMVMAGDTKTKGNAGAMNNAIAGYEKYLTGTPEEQKKAYEEAMEKAGDKVTPTEKYTNEIANTGAETLGLFSTSLPKFWTWASIITGLLTSMASQKLIGGAKGIINKVGTTKIGGKLASAGSKFLGGATKLLSSPVARVAGGVAGAALMAKDAVGGVKSANEWFGNEENGGKASTGQKVAAGIGGALGGTSSGLKGALGGAAKGAAIGTIFGPIGTAVGAGVGGLLGAIGGKRIAKAASAIGGAFKKMGKGIANVAGKGAKLYVSALKKSPLGFIGKTAKGIFSSWTDKDKSLGDKLKDTGKGLLKLNPAGYIASLVPKKWKDGAAKAGKKLFSAAKSVAEKTPIGKAVSGITNIWKDDSKSVGQKLKGTVGKLARLNPIGSIAGSIADTWKDDSKSTKDKIFGTVKALNKYNPVMMIANKLPDKWKDSAKKFASKATGVVKNIASKTPLGKMAKGVADVWKDDSKSMGEKIKGSIGAIADNLPLAKLIKVVFNKVKDNFNKIKSFAGDLVNTIKSVFTGMIDKVKSMIDNVKDKVKNSAVGKAAGALKKGWDTVTGWFASGSGEIPYDGYRATLHKGETVFNKTATKSIKDVLGITSKSVAVASAGSTNVGKLLGMLTGTNPEASSVRSNDDVIASIAKASVDIVAAINSLKQVSSEKNNSSSQNSVKAVPVYDKSLVNFESVSTT